MARSLRTGLACAALALGSALQQQAEQCKSDDVSFAEITSQTCTINWALTGSKRWDKVERVGCWKLMVYNTDKFLSSTVYRNSKDGRCVLAFSGYHGALAGYIRGAVSLLTPMTTWKMCGYDMYAPYARLLRHHTSLGNWSRIAHLLGGAGSPCRGELTFTAESMGGSSGEILAACANNGEIAQLQHKSLPSFKIHNIYTFGAPAASKTPIKSVLREDGCFPGKRVFFSGDSIAHFGLPLGLKHSRMDAVEIWPTPSGPTLRAYPCQSQDAIDDRLHQQPPPLNSTMLFTGKMDAVQHMITSYEDDMEWLHAAGLDKVMEMGPMEGDSAANYIKYAAPDVPKPQPKFPWR